MTSQTQPLPLPPPPKPESNWPKEYVAAALAIVIVGYTIFFAYMMFFHDEKVDSKVWEHQSSILQVLIALAGTVTGYYFGRIPAEKAAANAQHNAQTATQTSVANAGLATQAMQSEDRIRTRVNDLRTQVLSGSPVGGGAPGADIGTLRQHVADHIDEILRG